jgi:FKBP-type peptidyl-prolyl cis-trans isomerase
VDFEPPLDFKVELTVDGTGSLIPAESFVSLKMVARKTAGKVIYSNFDSDKTLDFRLGQKRVSKCIETGLEQMRKGSKAKISCPASWNADTGGRDDLIYEVYVVDFTPVNTDL